MKRYIKTIAVVWFPLSAHHSTSFASLAPRGCSASQPHEEEDEREACERTEPPAGRPRRGCGVGSYRRCC